ncbi:hypothetical protein ACFZDG_11040 [Kitasatospora xanthocidica]|uniref:hypothetical protein n=1 Tax=Kitasatospora xanthocidica TaxID=83382 RepID=UPI0036E0FE29
MSNDPTVEIQTELWVRVERGRWAWVPAGRDHPVEAEFVYTGPELVRVLYVYAATAARLMKVEKQRFRLVARALDRGGFPAGVVGIHEWRVSAESGRWVPTDVPWVIWNEVGRLVA